LNVIVRRLFVRTTTAGVPTLWTACVCFALLVPVVLVHADENEDLLNRAIQLFEQGQYTAAQEALIRIDVEALTEEQRALRDEFVDRTRVAITMVEKAELDFERADAAIEHEDFPAAKAALMDVLGNEYATAAQRNDARERLGDIEVITGSQPGETARPVPTDAAKIEPMYDIAPQPPAPTPTPAPQATPAPVRTPPRAPAATPVPQPMELITPEPPRATPRASTPQTAPPQAITPQPTPLPQATAPSAATTPQVSRQSVGSERANALTREGLALLESGRTAEAERLFKEALQLVPGHPEALAGLREAQRHTDVEVGSQSLLQRMIVRNQLAWERTVFQYRELEKEIKNAVLDKRFDLAQQGILRASQVLESGGQYADPRVRYESLVSELEALKTFVGEEQRRYEETRVREQRDEIQRKERARQQQVSETRRRQVTALMEQSLQLKKDGDYKSAIDVLDQVIAIDPRNNPARWMKDDLQDTYEIRRQYEATLEKRRQQQAVLVDTEEAKIPWHQLLKYPDNWLDIISGGERVATGRERLSAEDRQLHAKLDSNIPLDVEDVAFEEVIEELATGQGVNITVIWNDLEAVGVDRELPVTLRFASEVKFRKALSEILDQVGGGETKLGYVVNEGVIKIATQQLLDQEVYIDVYPIEDLLLNVPDFTGPEVSISDEGGEGGGGTGGGGFGGGGFGGGGGGGAGGGFGGGGFGGGGFGGGGLGGGGSQNPFSGGDEGEDEEEETSREERVDELLELIRNTIRPDSWRDSGGTVAAIAEINGQLVVTQTASAHSEIQDLLGKLREQRAIQIAIEARFITITSNYLEELGIDLDIILNQGNAGFDRAGRQYNGAQVLIPRSFSRLGFLPGVPGVGNPLQQGSAVVGPIGQPYSEVGLVPQAGNGLMHGSRFTPIPIVSNVIDLVQPTSTVVPNSFGGTTVPSMQVFGSFLDGIQVDFLLRATQADRRSSIMNAPRLVLFNGQRAWVGVLNTASYVQGLFPILDNNAVAQAPLIGQLQTGTVLDVQAVVSADKRYVTMNLRPGVRQPTGPLEVFPFSGGAAGGAAADAFIQLPNTQSQVIRTTVSVPDGGTLLIGGMKTTQEIEAEAGVPVLSKIPVLKRLYSARNLVKDEQVLLILVKPTIIIQREQEEAAFPTFGQRY